MYLVTAVASNAEIALFGHMWVCACVYVYVMFVCYAGICEVCPSPDCKLMVFPGSQRGTIHIVVSTRT